MISSVPPWLSRADRLSGSRCADELCNNCGEPRSSRTTGQPLVGVNAPDALATCGAYGFLGMDPQPVQVEPSLIS